MRLFAFERRWLAGMLETIIPAGCSDRYPQSALDTGAPEIFDEMLLYLPAATALGLRGAVLGIELLGPLAGLRKPARFSRLGPAEREACLTALSRSRVYFLRQLVLLLKSVACFGFGGDRGVHDLIGINLPPKFIRPGGTAKGDAN